MFSPKAWLIIASNFQSANIWINWTIFILGLLVTGYIVYETNHNRTQWGLVVHGIVLSILVSVLWPLAVGVIPILLVLGAVVGVVMLPKWVLVWWHVRKVEKAAMKAMAQSVDKT